MNMKKLFRKLAAAGIATVMCISLCSCGDYTIDSGRTDEKYTPEESMKELEAYYNEIAP